MTANKQDETRKIITQKVCKKCKNTSVITIPLQIKKILDIQNHDYVQIEIINVIRNKKREIKTEEKRE